VKHKLLGGDNNIGQASGSAVDYSCPNRFISSISAETCDGVGASNMSVGAILQAQSCRAQMRQKVNSNVPSVLITSLISWVWSGVGRGARDITVMEYIVVNALTRWIYLACCLFVLLSVCLCVYQYIYCVIWPGQCVSRIRSGVGQRRGSVARRHCHSYQQNNSALTAHG